MKTPYLIAPLFAVSLLFPAQTASGQELQRSMVYHATPQQLAVERAAASRQAAATVPTHKTGTQTQPSRVRIAKTKQTPAVRVEAVHAAPGATTVAPRTESAHTADATRSVAARVDLAFLAPAAPVATEAAKPFKTQPVFDQKSSPLSRKKIDKWFLISSAIFATGTIMDHASTVSAMRKDGAREGNPLLRNSSGGFSAGKHLALTGGVYGASLLLQRKHPRAANVLRIIGGAAKIGIALRNNSMASGRPDALPR